MSCNIVSQMNFLLHREQLNTPLVLLCYHTSVGKASKVCEMFMTAMPACPGCLLQIQYSTALKRHLKNWPGTYCLRFLTWICCPT